MKRPVVALDRLEWKIEVRFLGLTTGGSGPYAGVLMTAWAERGSPFSRIHIEPPLLVSVEALEEVAA